MCDVAEDDIDVDIDIDEDTTFFDGISFAVVTASVLADSSILGRFVPPSEFPLPFLVMLFLLVFMSGPVLFLVVVLGSGVCLAILTVLRSIVCCFPSLLRMLLLLALLLLLFPFRLTTINVLCFRFFVAVGGKFFLSDPKVSLDAAALVVAPSAVVLPPFVYFPTPPPPPPTFGRLVIHIEQATALSLELSNVHTAQDQTMAFFVFCFFVFRCFFVVSLVCRLSSCRCVLGFSCFTTRLDRPSFCRRDWTRFVPIPFC